MGGRVLGRGDCSGISWEETSLEQKPFPELGAEQLSEQGDLPVFNY